MKRSFFLLLGFLLFSGTAFPQVTGRIAGRVVNSKNEPLSGAKITIEGTLRGASTDLNGGFLIFNIRPGVYSVKVQFIGYKTVRIKNVMVVADQTTKLNVTMQEGALKLGKAVVITAEKPLIQKDETSKIVTITATEIRAIPVNNIE